MGRKLKSLVSHNLFLLLLLCTGVIFMILTGSWRRYGESAVGVYAWGRSLWNEAQGMEEEDSKRPETGKDGSGAEAAGAEQVEKAAEIEKTENPEVQEDPAKEENPTGATAKETVWQSVEEDYFDDALFIGDSRVVGLQDYGKMEENATFYASTGLTIYRLLSAKIAPVEGQRTKISVEEALGEKKFGKIYLMVGINELDIGTVERFQEKYREVVTRIQELQPDAIIYLQSIMTVTQKRSEKGDYVTNEGILERNRAIEELADQEKIFYLDVNEAVCDESGVLNSEYTSDGVHLKVKYIPLWKEYLMNHAVFVF